MASVHAKRITMAVVVIRIGLTGGIAAGKSTVSTKLRELGAVLVDYDLLARHVVEPGSIGLQRIAECFGPDALTDRGELNRAWMAEHVFSGADAERKRKMLDGIEHPLIYALAVQLEHEAVEADCQAVVVHDIPLLAEVIDSIPFEFDHIVTVEAPEQVRVSRMMTTRGMSESQAWNRVNHQSSVEQRLAIADEVIDSTQPLEQMFEHIDMLMKQWRTEAR